MRKSKPVVTFLIDSAETRGGYTFSRIHRGRDLSFGGCKTVPLPAGDYAVEIAGEVLPCMVERKALGDLFGVVGNGRERFVRELEKLQWMTSYIVIEADFDEVKHGFERSAVSGEAALGSLIHWSVMYGVHPIFAGSHRQGREATQRLLEEFAKHWLERFTA